MEYNQLHINSLVELYWKGETSIAEENTLRNLCKTSDQFKKEFPDLSLYLESQNELLDVKVPASLEANILKQTTKPNSTLKPILWFSGIAATLALFIWIVPAQQSQDYTDQEVQQAYKETKNALFLLSNKIDEGNNYAFKLSEFDKNHKKLKQNSKTK
jgi:hypothetical protein